MRRVRALALASIAGIVLAASGLAGAQEVVKHSGVIVDVDERAGTFVLAEIGPWEIRDGRTVITRRTITLTPATEFAIVFRDDEAPSGFAGDYVETPLEPWAVYVDDHVTIECRHEGPRFVALKIVVTDLPGGSLREAAWPRVGRADDGSEAGPHGNRSTLLASRVAGPLLDHPRGRA